MNVSNKSDMKVVHWFCLFVRAFVMFRLLMLLLWCMASGNCMANRLGMLENVLNVVKNGIIGVGMNCQNSAQTAVREWMVTIMAEYIDREAYVDFFKGEHNLYSWEEIEEFMDSIPTADVQPVKWISVTERLPDFEGSLLCMRKTAFGLSGQEVLYYEDGEFSYDGIEPLAGGTVTHWMPLPEPPKDGET